MPRTKPIRIQVKPELIEWAIRTAGWEKGDLIRAMSISESTYNNCLEGNITIKQLENLAKKTKRPLAAFFLPKTPIEEPNPKDYRMLPDKKGKFERKTILAIRKARYLQEISSELSLNIHENLNLRLRKVRINDNPQEIAEIYRSKFNLNEKQEEFKSKPYRLYDYLREKLEDFNIFSFQISMPIEDARGFALADKTPKVIVVNSADDIKPRIFTLIHEFAHILLGETSLDIPNFQTQDKIERWCNNFSAFFLLPKDILIKIYEENKQNLTSSKVLTRISNKFNISKSMFLYNLSKYNYITKQDYNNFLNAISTKKKKTSSGGGGVKQDKKCVSTLGKKFISLVADNIEKEQITTSDALSYLSIKSRNLDKVISRAGK